ncbi:hypothetical protein [Fusibacter sp. JL216-2]|uniref:hypothetical protein n=1 Tax=Fusibacter sp. JL216-2 TaxID=3071453 RepID=UPI003D32E82C
MKKTFKKLSNNFFALLMRIGWNRAFYGRVRSLLKATEGLDDTSVMKRAKTMMVHSYASSVFISVIYASFTKNLVFAGVLFFIVLITKLTQVINTRDVQVNLKNGFEILDEEFKNADSKIESTFSNAVEKSNGGVKEGFFKIFNIVKAPREKAEALLEQYSNESHWIMSILAKASHFVKRHGDHVTEDGASTYQKVVRLLQKELNADYLNSEHVRLRARGHGLLILAPILLIPLIDRYVTFLAKNIGITDLLINGFYNKPLGQSLEIFLLVMMVSFYSDYLETVSQTSLLSVMEDPLEPLLKVKWINRMLKKKVPKRHTRAYIKLKRKIVYSGLSRKVELHILRKGLYLILGVVLGFFIISYSVLYRNHMLLTDIGYGTSDDIYQTNIVNISLMYDEAKIKEIVKKEAAVIRKLADISQPTISQTKHIMKDSDLVIQNELTAKRLIQKSREYGIKKTDLTFGVLLIIAFGVYGYVYPDHNLNRRQKLYGSALLYEETMKLRTLVLSLKDQHNMTVEKVLKELQKASSIFNESIIEINTGFSNHKGREAIERAIEEIEYYPFQSLLSRLISASTKMSVAEAFDDIGLSISFAELERRDRQAFISSNQVAKIQARSELIINLTMFGYFLMPVIVAAFVKFSNLNMVSV